MAAKSSMLIGLGLYLAVNFCLNISNKQVLEDFPYPWLMTMSHASSTYIGCLLLSRLNCIKLTEVAIRDKMILVIFSILFTINIAICNISLALVSLPFHQVMRSTGPIFTVLANRYLFAKRYESWTYISLIAITIGIGLATYGDYRCTLKGFGLTTVGVALAVAKTVATNKMMTGGSRLHPIEVLLRMSPPAALISCAFAIWAGEVTQSFVDLSNVESIPVHSLRLLLVNMLLATMQNVISFYTNKETGALTLMVCANLKQSLTILFGIMVFDVQVSLLNGVGMVVALGGSAWYSWLTMVKADEVHYALPETRNRQNDLLPSHLESARSLQN